MQTRRVIQALTALALVALTMFNVQTAQAGTCAFKTPLISITCNPSTGCVESAYQLRLGAGCTAGTVDLEQSADGSNWSTVATNLSSTWSYCPGNSGEYYYRLKINCTPCGQTTYGPTEGPIGCP